MAARVATQSAIERFGGGAVFGVKLVSPRRRSQPVAPPIPLRSRVSARPSWSCGAAVSQPPLEGSTVLGWPGIRTFFRSPQPAAALKRGILQRYVVVFASKTGSMSGRRGDLLHGCAGQVRDRDPDVAGCPSVWYRATLIHKTAFGAAKVVEPAEPEDAVKSSTPPGAAKPAAHPSGRRPQRLQLGVQAAGHHQASTGVPGPSATTPDLRDHCLRRDRPEPHRPAIRHRRPEAVRFTT